MKSRIEELAQRIYMDEGDMPSLELRCKVITDAVNEALELAAKECENQEDEYQLPDQRFICAEAIRKLKV